jgi:hypothetical protein
MSARASRHGTDAGAEIDNLICCLEFLASEALAADLRDVHAVIARSVQEIAAIREAAATGVCPALPSTDILQAFKLLVRFCLIGDPQAKREIVRMLESIDQEALSAYA